MTVKNNFLFFVCLDSLHPLLSSISFSFFFLSTKVQYYLHILVCGCVLNVYVCELQRDSLNFLIFFSICNRLPLNIPEQHSVPKRINRLWCRRRRRRGADFAVRADLEPSRAGTKSDCAVRD